MKAREGDLIETREGLIFDVKGLLHPPDRVISYARYFPHSMGDRERVGKRYKKVYSLNERQTFLSENYPQYLYYDEIHGKQLEGVPTSVITKHYEPIAGLKTLSERNALQQIEMHALYFSRQLHKASIVPFNKIGVSGSILIGLQKDDSDVDLIVYGRENGLRVHKTLKGLLEDEGNEISRYDLRGLKQLYRFRVKDTKVPFRDFVKTESRKVYQGRIFDRDYFIRFVLDWSDIEEEYGDRRFKTAGRSTIKAKIDDDSNSIFTPCLYLITECEFLSGRTFNGLKEITSYRGRFCEQAKKDEVIQAEGAVEKVTEKNGSFYHRLILGEHRSDYMILK